MMRDRTPYTSDELAEIAEQCEEFCPRRAATFRELIALRDRFAPRADDTETCKHEFLTHNLGDEHKTCIECGVSFDSE
jgi:NAD-dependent dihydropyrimidine dehydrogenase PreA subunit